jgi:hypothetical protein
MSVALAYSIAKAWIKMGRQCTTRSDHHAVISARTIQWHLRAIRTAGTSAETLRSAQFICRTAAGGLHTVQNGRWRLPVSELQCMVGNNA